MDGLAVRCVLLVLLFISSLSVGLAIENLLAPSFPLLERLMHFSVQGILVLARVHESAVFEAIVFETSKIVM